MPFEDPIKAMLIKSPPAASYSNLYAEKLAINRTSPNKIIGSSVINLFLYAVNLAKISIFSMIYKNSVIFFYIFS